MRDRISESSEMPRFWPPRASGFWRTILRAAHRRLLRKQHRIAEVEIRGADRLDQLGPADGVLICPNHSYTGDGQLMIDVSYRLNRLFHVMAAWHVFRGHWGLDGFLLQRVGVFSVDREGCDRQAIRTAIDLLSSGKSLVIFPEGEIYHLNEKLTPLREGVAFMAVSAQRELEKQQSGARVWIVPTAIRYQFLEDVMPRLEASVTAIEKRLLLKPRPLMPLHERILRVGEMLLTIKEKEKLGRSYDDDGESLPSRIGRMTQTLLERLETEQLKKSHADEPVPVRVKLLRQQLLEGLCDDGATARHPAIHDALDDVYLVLQLFSYPGDYLSSRPTVERMAETIEKFEEDVYGTFAAPKGDRRATVTFGEPIDVKSAMGAGRPRTVAGDLTTMLEASLGAMVGTSERV